MRHVFFLMALFAMLQRAYGANIIADYRSCRPGYLLFNNVCFPKEFLDEFNDNPKVHEVPCKCVPFYQCRHEDVQDMQSKCKSSEVCCKGGAPADDYEEFPWMVAILKVTANETWNRKDFISGGSIIHQRVVLTAAHKIRKNTRKMLRCRAGERTRTASEPHLPQDRLVARLLIHPAYDRQYMANDVALLVLTEPFNISQPAVRPVCLGKGKPHRCSECFAMGWGRSQFNISKYADKLKKVQVDLVSRGVCWRALQAVDDARRRTRRQEPLERGELHSSLLCAGGEGQDTCVGDGGSPLVCHLQVNATHARSAVFGMAAWGLGCGVVGAPGVYVNVGEIHSWIVNRIKNLR